MSNAYRIVFAGTPAFAIPSLEKIFHSSHKVVAVYTQADKPSGRGQKISASPVKLWANAHDLPVIQPPTLKDPDAQKILADLNPDVMVVAAYGLLLPQAVLDIPRVTCINVHASLLPRWRGAAPVPYAILEGDTKTGVSIMKMTAGLDEGPVLSQTEIPIADTDTSETLLQQLAERGATLLLQTLEDLHTALSQAKHQSEQDVRLSPKLDKKKARLDFQEPAALLARKIRAFIPWPIAYVMLNNEPLRILRAVAVNEQHSHTPGTVINTQHDYMDVNTQDGILRIFEVQIAGHTPQPARTLYERAKPLVRVGDVW